MLLLWKYVLRKECYVCIYQDCTVIELSTTYIETAQYWFLHNSAGYKKHYK